MYNVHLGASVPWLMAHVTSQEFIFFVGGGKSEYQNIALQAMVAWH